MVFLLCILNHKNCDIIRKNLERQETNKNGRGTEQHLPKTDENVIRPRLSGAKAYTGCVKIPLTGFEDL